MADPYIGELKLVPYNFAPRGWAFCAGQLLPIAQNTALFSLLGTTYGGNGVSTFGLPDLRGRIVVHPGQGPGLSNYDQGERAGVESVTLTQSQIPAHNHLVQVNGNPPTQATAPGAFAAQTAGTVGNTYGTVTTGNMPSATIATVGGSQPHSNEQPYLTLNYVIALEGVFPPRN
ncbi:MAG: tail fiber protein [Fimbriimonadaceae bacterium]